MTTEKENKEITKRTAYIIIISSFLIGLLLFGTVFYFASEVRHPEERLKKELIKLATLKNIDTLKISRKLKEVSPEEREKDPFYDQLHDYYLVFEYPDKPVYVKERMSSLDPDYEGSMQEEFRKVALEYFENEEQWRKEYKDFQEYSKKSHEIMVELIKEGRKNLEKEKQREKEATASLKSSISSLSDSEKINIWGFSKEIVKSNLKVSSTSKFPSYSSSYIQLEGNNIYIRSYVDAENSFGTKIRNHFIVTLDADSKAVKDVVFVN